MTNTIFPQQPIKDGRFIKNSIVRFLLDSSESNLSDLDKLPFTDSERSQFAQLIGYSVNGFEELGFELVKKDGGVLCKPEIIGFDLGVDDQSKEYLNGELVENIDTGPDLEIGKPFDRSKLNGFMKEEMG